MRAFGWREYSVRYIDSSGEGLLQFSSESQKDIELRSRDVMIAVFVRKTSKKSGKIRYLKKLRGIYNCIIGRYYSIK